jgi:glycosyl transferase family 25
MEIHPWRKAYQSWRQNSVDNMQNLFDHIYVLNLDRRPDRWSAIQKQLNIACITKATRFSAIDKKPGWVGCYESHLAILQKAVELNARNVLILEDDAELYLDWMLIWRTARQQIADNWDMLYLGYNIDPAVKFQSSMFAASYWLRLGDVLTTHAYAVNGKYLVKLIEHVKSFIGSGVPIDVVYAKNLDKINAYGIYPMIFHQSSGMSDILGCETSFNFRGNIDHALNR